MIREGQIKGYGDLDQEKQREEVKELYLECKMPAHKFRSLWNQVKKRDKVTSRKMRTWDKNELQSLAAQRCPIQIGTEISTSIQQKS